MIVKKNNPFTYIPVHTLEDGMTFYEAVQRRLRSESNNTSTYSVQQ